jgi:hypothetical protein
MSEKIQPVSIHLIHGTGPSDVGEGLANGVIAGTEAKVETYEAANDLISTWISTNPVGRPELVDWSITFENGEAMTGTYQIIRENGVANRADIIPSITSGLLRLTSDDPADAPFKKFVDKDGSKGRQATLILESYNLGLDEPATSFTP